MLLVCGACGRIPLDMDIDGGAPGDDAPPRQDGAPGIDAGPRIDAPPGNPVAPRINEYLVNHDGIDASEYVEVLGTASADLSALTIVEIDGDGTSAGRINSAHTVGTTSAQGYYVTPFLSSLQNNTTTLLLVEGFSGTVGSDLDPGDDGVLDNQPWTTILDAVAYADATTDKTYAGAVRLTDDFDGAAKIVGGASRIPDGRDTDAIGDWTRNDSTGEGLPCCPIGNALSGEANATPGTANTVEP
jgi:hypothetical protein